MHSDGIVKVTGVGQTGVMKNPTPPTAVFGFHKPNLAPSMRGAGNLIPGKSMDYSQVNSLLSI